MARGDAAEPMAIANPSDDAENAEPLSEILVRDRAVATSGDYRRGFDVGGVRYSHIVDPRTGRPADDVISSTVVAPNPDGRGRARDGVFHPAGRGAQRLASSIDGVEYLLVEKDGTTMTSPGWRGARTAGRDPRPRAADLAPSRRCRGSGIRRWSCRSISKSPLLGGPAKRPFVAIWIEDADSFPVRTLALWYHEDRYLTEMKAWYRADRLRSMSESTSIVRTVGAPPGRPASTR